QPGPDLSPVLTTDQKGRLVLAYQQWGEQDGAATTAVKVCDNGKWVSAPEVPAAARAPNAWHPSLSAGPDGATALADDAYRAGDYDVRLRLQEADAKPGEF